MYSEYLDQMLFHTYFPSPQEWLALSMRVEYHIAIPVHIIVAKTLYVSLKSLGLPIIQTDHLDGASLSLQRGLIIVSVFSEDTSE